MDKNVLHMNLIKISLQLTMEQIFVARENRDWDEFDQMTEIEQLLYKLEELEMYEDIIDPNFEVDF